MEIKKLEPTKNLKNLNLDISYRSDRSEIVSDFYIPCLANSVMYKRAVGYFTSEGIELVMRGITQFIKNDGVMQLIASPSLSEKDIEAIKSGYEDRKNIVEESIVSSIDGVVKGLTESALNCLTWMIANKYLDIQIAVSIDDCTGIFHEKIGIFIDSDGNRVAFTGSVNETKGGFVNNFESIDVYRSWNDSEGRTIRKETDFDRLWNNTTNNVLVIDFPTAAKEILVKRAPIEKPDMETVEINKNFISENQAKYTVFPRQPLDIQLHSYQEEALKNWFKNNAQGIFRMATGTGKTITALWGCFKLAELCKKEKKSFLTIIVCPYTHLIKQWSEEAKRFGIYATECFDDYDSWRDNLLLQKDLLRSQEPWFSCVMVTYTTFQKQTFQSLINTIDCATLIIADEVHNAGTEKIIENLPEKIQFRLGLSATPERYMDLEGTKGIYNYFKKDIFEVGLAEAINVYKTLTPYYYYPVLIRLTEEEQEKYYTITKEISKLMNFKDVDSGDQRLKNLLFQRARLLGGLKIS